MVAAIAGVVGAAGSIYAGMNQADAAGDASQAQQQSTREANALQLAMYNNNVNLSAPAVNTGNAARDRLSMLLGLSGRGFSGSTLPQAGVPGLGGAGGSPQPNSYEALRAQMAPQFTSQSGGGGAPVDVNAYVNTLDPFQQMAYRSGRTDYVTSAQANAAAAAGAGGGGGSTVDEAGLNAAIQARMQAQQDAQAQAEAAARADPAFGSLTQGFQFNQYTPDKFTPDTFSYTGQDLPNDPSYQFRLQQGQKALDRQGLAAGRFLSGGQLQASSNYNQGAASQEFQNAYQRAQSTFNTNETGKYNAFNVNETNRANAFNTGEANRFNAYQTGFQNTVNPLLALSGAGQLSGGQLMQANMQTANAMGSNLIGGGNAAAGGILGQATGINNAINGGINAYQNNSLLNRFGGYGGVNSNPTFISPSNQSSFESLLGSNNYYGTGG